MSEPLLTYLHDHLAGAAAAVTFLEAMRNDLQGQDLGDFAAELLAEIESDRAILKGLAERLGDEASEIKEAAAWLGAKLSRWKLQGESVSEIGVFESLEALTLGIHGKRALWNALAAIAPSDDRLSGLDFQGLADRAREQHDRVEDHRLRAAKAAFFKRRS